ncbi:MAG: hypothetical protein ABMA64_30765 [Myxococcota bacterium]
MGGCAGWLALACAGFGRSGPEGCPSGTTRVESPAGRGDDRWVEDTSLAVCTGADGARTGPQLERYATGAIAAEGHWVDGARDGAWTRWTPEGAFDGRATFRAGVEHGPRWEVDRSGVVTEITLDQGLATGWRALDPDTPMPEWDGDTRVEGTRYSR